MENAKMSPPGKSDSVSRYHSKNVKSVNSLKTAAIKMSAPVTESSPSTSQGANRGSENLSKYTKPGKPTIAEIFGASVDNGGNVSCDTSQVEEIDVTGDGEPNKEPPSWIETGPMEAKGAPKSKSKVSSALANRFGVPDMGFADLISQSAAVAQSGFPINDAIIEGAAHPANKPPPKPLAPQKKKLIQQHLILLLHAYKCEKAKLTKLPCPVPFCSVMKKVQAHMRECTDGYNCSAPFCSSSRRIMCHWKHCKTADCVVCSRLKNLAMRKKELEKMKAIAQLAHAQAQAHIQAQAQANIQPQAQPQVQPHGQAQAAAQVQAEVHLPAQAQVVANQVPDLAIAQQAPQPIAG